MSNRPVNFYCNLKAVDENLYEFRSEFMLPAVSNPPQQKRRVKKTPPKIVLKTWDDAMAYFAKHLKPIAFGPKGQPIYDREDMDALNVQLPVA